MPVFTDPVEFIREVVTHVRRTKHEVISADDPAQQMVGFVCTDCPDTQYPIWEIRLPDVHAARSSPERTIILEMMRSSDARSGVFRILTEGTSPFFREGGFDLMLSDLPNDDGQTNPGGGYQGWRDLGAADPGPLYPEASKASRVIIVMRGLLVQNVAPHTTFGTGLRQLTKWTNRKKDVPLLLCVDSASVEKC